MTKEEALTILKYNSKVIHQTVNGETGPNEVEALDMAIKALAQPTSDDCVSRQAVIDMTGLSNWFESSDDYNSFVENLCKLPPVTLTQRWIPVSERLPEEETDVLICNANKEIAISRGSYSTEIENAFIWYTSGWRFGEVLAWQPLPKAYEEK